MSNKTPLQLEYLIRTSPKILFEFLSQPFGLTQWFADEVEVSNDIYSFIWDGHSNKAKVVEKKNNDYIRFQWEDSPAEEYFEFNIRKNEVTGDTALVVTDTTAEAGEEEQKRLWDTQINTLIKRIGG